jgi:hypothetical protein
MGTARSPKRWFTTTKLHGATHNPENHEFYFSAVETSDYAFLYTGQKKEKKKKEIPPPAMEMPY